MGLLVLILALVIIVLLIALKEKHEKRNEPEQGTLQYYLHKSKEHEDKKITPEISITNIVTTDALAQVLLEIAWDSHIGENESAVITASNINSNVYKVEILCLNIFSTLYGFSIWPETTLFTKEQEKEIVDKFYSLIKYQCMKSGNSNELFALITSRISTYFQAHQIDSTKSLQGSFSVELPSAFVGFVASNPENSPRELMMPISNRFYRNVSTTIEILNKFAGGVSPTNKPSPN